MEADSNVIGGHQSAMIVLKKIIDEVENESVVSAIKDSSSCQESYPCGHRGPFFINGKPTKVHVGSVAAGYIQYFYFPQTATHFTHYVFSGARIQIDRLRQAIHTRQACIIVLGLSRCRSRVIGQYNRGDVLSVVARCVWSTRGFLEKKINDGMNIWWEKNDG